MAQNRNERMIPVQKIVRVCKMYLAKAVIRNLKAIQILKQHPQIYNSYPHLIQDVSNIKMFEDQKRRRHQAAVIIQSNFRRLRVQRKYKEAKKAYDALFKINSQCTIQHPAQIYKMVDDFRKELDELMGKDRNVPVRERAQRSEHFDDSDVCKYFLALFCPHDLFINTRSDLGRCKRRHDTFFKQMYLQDPNRLYYQKKYELELLELLESLVVQVDARIRRSLARIEAPLPDTERNMEVQDRKNALNALINRRMKEAEQLGEAGRVNDAEQLMKEIEQLKEQRQDTEGMVCEICGAMQSTTDTERRQVSHLEGKQHIGFATIRKCIEELRSHRDMYRHIDINKPPPKPEKSRSRSPRRS